MSSAPIADGVMEPVAEASAAAPAKPAPNVLDLVDEKKDPVVEEAKEPPAKKGRTAAAKRKPAPKKKK